MSTYLTPQNSPRVKLIIEVDSSWKEIDCLIDTGFSSGLVLNPSFLPKINSPVVAKQEFELADGSLITFDMYLVTVKYRQQKKRLLTVFSGSGDNLAGIRFLEGLIFTLNLKKKQITLI